MIVIVIVIVIVNVGGPVIVAVHVNGNAPVSVIDFRKSIEQGSGIDERCRPW